MNDLQIFENPMFGKVRTYIEPDGKVLFCGSDVTKALGYSNPRDAVNKHCRCVVKRDTPHPQSPSKQIEMSFIPEGDIYRLAAKSELPGAEEFESWIFDEVIPSIRKTGGYSIAVPQTLPEALRLAADLAEKNMSLTTENETQRQIIGELQPKADYVDYILSSIGTVTTTQIAADYCMTANQLNKILQEERIQRKVDGQWVLYKEHIGMGYTKSETIPITLRDGMPATKMFTKWTQKGRLKINEALNSRGIYANMDLIHRAN